MECAAPELAPGWLVSGAPSSGPPLSAPPPSAAPAETGDSYYYQEAPAPAPQKAAWGGDCNVDDDSLGNSPAVAKELKSRIFDRQDPPPSMVGRKIENPRRIGSALSRVPRRERRTKLASHQLAEHFHSSSHPDAKVDIRRFVRCLLVAQEPDERDFLRNRANLALNKQQQKKPSSSSSSAPRILRTPPASRRRQSETSMIGVLSTPDVFDLPPEDDVFDLPRPRSEFSSHGSSRRGRDTSSTWRSNGAYAGSSEMSLGSPRDCYTQEDYSVKSLFGNTEDDGYSVSSGDSLTVKLPRTTMPSLAPFNESALYKPEENPYAAAFPLGLAITRTDNRANLVAPLLTTSSSMVDLSFRSDAQPDFETLRRDRVLDSAPILLRYNA